MSKDSIEVLSFVLPFSYIDSPTFSTATCVEEAKGRGRITIKLLIVMCAAFAVGSGIYHHYFALKQQEGKQVGRSHRSTSDPQSHGRTSQKDGLSVFRDELPLSRLLTYKGDGDVAIPPPTCLYTCAATHTTFPDVAL